MGSVVLGFDNVVLCCCGLEYLKYQPAQLYADLCWPGPAVDDPVLHRVGVNRTCACGAE